MKILTVLAHSRSPFLNPDRNVILRSLVKKTFYAQFCAGENKQEVQQTIESLRGLGFKGVILAYAKEDDMDEKSKRELLSPPYDTLPTEEAYLTWKEGTLKLWKKGTLATVAMAEPGDFVALKLTGAGSQAMYALSRYKNPPPALGEAIMEICDLASSCGVRILFDAEQHYFQPGIDAWALNYMRRYNSVPGHALVYATYQTYLKSTHFVLAEHLSIAKQEGFTLGVKLVRGAYLGSDPRHLIHDTKSDTDFAYDNIASDLLQKRFGPVFKHIGGPFKAEDMQPFPHVSLVLAGHNLESVRKAQAIRNSQKEKDRIDMVYAQLQGMADNVSYELVQASRSAGLSGSVDPPQTYKYLVWGTTGECIKYLLRRAQENRDALQRTKECRNAMVAEFLRRAKAAVGFKV